MNKQLYLPRITLNSEKLIAVVIVIVVLVVYLCILRHSDTMTTTSPDWPAWFWRQSARFCKENFDSYQWNCNDYFLLFPYRNHPNRDTKLIAILRGQYHKTLTALVENIFGTGLRRCTTPPNTKDIFSQPAINILWYCHLKYNNNLSLL